MRLWTIILLVVVLLLLALLLLVLCSRIRFVIRLKKSGGNDRAEMEVSMLYGLLKLHYRVPQAKLENWNRGLRLKLRMDAAGPLAPGQAGGKGNEQIDKSRAKDWWKSAKRAFKATKGLKRWAYSLLARCQIHQLDWSTDFSLGDAASTATAAGAVWGAKWSVISWMSRRMRLMNRPRVFVAPVFEDRMSVAMDLICKGSLSAAYVLYSLFVLLWRVLRTEGGWTLWKSLLLHYKQSGRQTG